MEITEQQNAIIENQGNCFVLASAGSGKTTTVVRKIVNIKTKRPDARILYITFTRKAKKHAVEKIGNIDNVMVTNFHSLAYMVLNSHKQELGMNAIDIVPDSYCTKILSELFPGEDNRKLRKKLDAINRLKVECVSVKEMNPHQKSLYVQFQQIMDANHKFTYSDLLVKFLAMINSRSLKENFLTRVLRFDYLMCDEVNDNNKIQFKILEALLSLNPAAELNCVGDLIQCIEGETKVGNTKAKDLKIGDPVPSYRNGELILSKVKSNIKSDWTTGYEIETESGKKIKVSPNHKLYATLPELPQGHFIIYLMYRFDLGFRIGISQETGYCRNHLKYRLRQELGERLWIIKSVSSKPEAIYWENYYSLKYSLVKAPFELESRGMESEYYLKLFNQFGNNGFRFLEEKNMSFNYPNLVNATFSIEKYNHKRYRINFIAHNIKGSWVSFEFSYNAALYTYLSKFVKLTKAKKDNRFRFRKYFNNYDNAINFLLDLTNSSPFPFVIREQLYMKGVKQNKPVLVFASNIVPYMSVPVHNWGELKLEKVVSVKKVKGDFYSLAIKGTQNFLGNEILSHNTLYTWRGSRPDLCANFMQSHNMTMLPLTKNFRSQMSIIDLGNRMLDIIDDYSDFKYKMNYHKDRGSNVVYRHYDNIDESYYCACQEIQELVRKGIDYRDINVLFRTNNSGNRFERQAIRCGIPFRLLKGNFLNRKIVQYLIQIIRMAHYITEKSPDDEISRYLQPLSYEIAPDIGTKTYKALYNHDCDLGIVDKIKYADKLEVSGIGAARKASFKTFYSVLSRIIEIYTNNRDNSAELITQLSKIALEFKYFRRITNAQFNSVEEDIDEFKSLLEDFGGSIIQRINNLMADFTGSDDSKEEEEDKVVGMTVHQAKGTEAKAIFIIDAQDFPLDFTIDTEGEEEEKRCLYVAITRAMDHLFLFSSVKQNYYADRLFSDFEYYDTNTNVMAYAW